MCVCVCVCVWGGSDSVVEIISFLPVAPTRVRKSTETIRKLLPSHASASKTWLQTDPALNPQI